MHTNFAQLYELRIMLNQRTESIVSGLKDRSRYGANKRIFTEQFADGLTWFEYRAREEQKLDARFGRFRFPGQYPLFGDMSKALEVSAVERATPRVGLAKVIPRQNLGHKILGLYLHAIDGLCLPAEVPQDYGQVTRLDVANCIDIGERIVYFGQLIAANKLAENDYLLNLNEFQLKQQLRDPERELEVTQVAKDAALRYGITPMHSVDVVGDLFRGIIDLTLEVECDYILALAPSLPTSRGMFGSSRKSSGIGWGQGK